MAFRIIFSGLIISCLFVAIYMRHHSLWPAIGFHTGWNFVISAVLGTPISGFSINRSLFIIEMDGSSWITGGEFGIETSLITNFIVLVAAVLLLRYPFNKKIDLMSSEL